MKVGIVNDASPKTGVGKYGVELARNLSDSKGIEADLIQKDYGDSYPQYSADRYTRGLNLPAMSRTVNDLLDIFSVERDNYDLLHFNTLKGVNPRPGDFVTVHDIMPLKLQSNYSSYHTWRFQRNLHKTVETNLVCVSEQTRRDLIQEKQYSYSSCRTIPNGVDTDFYTDIPMGDAKLQLQLPSENKYLLHVGSAEARKNIEFLAQLLKELPEIYKLIRVGPSTGALDDLEDRTVFFNNVSEEEMVQLYNSAEYLLLPSLYEGFGRPVIEALSCGTQVIKSKKNVPKFESAFNLDLETDLWRRTILNGREHDISVERYSWERIAGELATYYTQCHR